MWDIWVFGEKGWDIFETGLDEMEVLHVVTEFITYKSFAEFTVKLTGDLVEAVK